MSHDDLLNRLNEVPALAGESTTLGELRAIKKLSVDRNLTQVEVVLPFACQSQHASLTERLQKSAGIPLNVQIQTRIDAHLAQAGTQVLPNVKNVIAVASGKGGVGKSTTAVNLALALVAEGARVGLLDADIYGPSVPTLLGVDGKPELNEQELMVPHERYGIQTNSIGFLIDNDAPMAWRGPMVSQALQQLFAQTAWDNLDYLVVDMPPGTGDIQLTMSQKIPVSGAVIVTTPQDLALMDARKGLVMFEKTNIPVLGIVENMALHVCSNCGHEEAIFGSGGAAAMSADYHVPLLGQLPLAMAIREQADAGKPIVVAEPNGVHAQHYTSIARQVGLALARRPKDLTHKIRVSSVGAQ